MTKTKTVAITMSLEDAAWILTAVKLRQEAAEENGDTRYARRWKAIADTIRKQSLT